MRIVVLLLLFFFIRGRYCLDVVNWQFLNDTPVNNLNAPTYGPPRFFGANFNPGGRIYPATWNDAMDNFFYLFGGGENSVNYYNDMWVLNGNTNQWAWFGGEEGFGGNGTFGVWPSARESTAYWIDPSNGNLLMYGGIVSLVSAELWSYNIMTQRWTLLSDVNANVSHVKGEVSPGFRYGGAGWSNEVGSLYYLFGGVDALGSNAIHQTGTCKYNPFFERHSFSLS